MIAYRILVNGKLIATIGQPDMSILNAGIVTSRGNAERGVDDYIRMPLHGMSHDTETGFPQHFRWKEQTLSVGDRIEIEIVETNDFDPPLKRYRSDAMVQEDPFTDEEVREMRYQDYLELKKEFGDKDDA